MQAEANDYVEKEFGAVLPLRTRHRAATRSPTSATASSGTPPRRAGLSVQNFGEYIYNPYSLPADAPDWDTWYADVADRCEDGPRARSRSPTRASTPGCSSDIPSLQAIIDPCFPNFQLAIPDQYRVDMWLPVFYQQTEDRAACRA